MPSKFHVRPEKGVNLFSDLKYGDWFKLPNHPTNEVFIKIKTPPELRATALRLTPDHAEITYIGDDIEVIDTVPTINIPLNTSAL